MKKHPQKGFSILEILVAITISLILMLGLLQIFISNKNTYRLENNLAMLQENGRFLHDYLNKLVRNTAYRSPLQDTQFNNIETIYTGANIFISGTDNTGPNNSDSMVIRFQGSGDGAGNPDNSIRDCINRGLDLFVMSSNTLSLDANNNLQCQSDNPSAAPAVDTQVILDGVENMQILYGEDLDGDKAPDRFVSAAHPNLDFNNVVGVKISLLLRSNEPNKPIPDNNTYNLLGTAYQAPGDLFLRQTITFTIMLRNVVTEVIM